MAEPIHFHFDFSSPYAYIASTKIDAIAAKHGREVAWHPMLLGVAFKAMGMQMLASIPMKGAYSIRDFDRSARFHGVAYRHPSTFPIATVAAARAFLWLDARDTAAARHLGHALFRAYFVDDVNIVDAATVVALAAAQGIDADEITAGMSDPAIKERLKNEVDAAIAAGVFGSPFIFVDGEPFWGVDRLDQVDRWLSWGGF